MKDSSRVIPFGAALFAVCLLEVAFVATALAYPFVAVRDVLAYNRPLRWVWSRLRARVLRRVFPVLVAYLVNRDVPLHIAQAWLERLMDD